MNYLGNFYQGRENKFFPSAEKVTTALVLTGSVSSALTSACWEWFPFADGLPMANGAHPAWACSSLRAGEYRPQGAVLSPRPAVGHSSMDGRAVRCPFWRMSDIS